MVVYTHANEIAVRKNTGFSWSQTWGMMGVDIFFVISGFIMVYITADARSGTKSPVDFFSYRFTRIFPIYWIATALMTILAANQILAAAPQQISPFLHNMFLWPYEHGGKPQPYPILPVAWTLRFELAFYLIFSIALLWHNLRIQVASLLCFGAVWGVTFLDYPLVSEMFVRQQELFIEFVYGMIMADMFLRIGSDKIDAFLRKRLVSMILAGLCVGAFSLIVYSDRIHLTGARYNRPWSWGVPALLFSVLFVLWLESVMKQQSWLSWAAVLVGNASYSIYLFHPMVTMAFRDYYPAFTEPGFAKGICLTLLLLVISTFAGVLIHVAIEQPILNTTRRAYKALQRGSTSAAFWRRPRPRTVPG